MLKGHQKSVGKVGLTGSTIHEPAGYSNFLPSMSEKSIEWVTCCSKIKENANENHTQLQQLCYYNVVNIF